MMIPREMTSSRQMILNKGEAHETTLNLMPFQSF